MAFLKGETSAWLEDPTGKHVQVVGESPHSKWTVEEIWGFELINGKRYHTKRLVGINGAKEARVKLVYDLIAPLETDA